MPSILACCSLVLLSLVTLMTALSSVTLPSQVFLVYLEKDQKDPHKWVVILFDKKM